MPHAALQGAVVEGLLLVGDLALDEAEGDDTDAIIARYSLPSLGCVDLGPLPAVQARRR